MSDQDFFFDEDEKPAAKAPVKKTGGGSAPAKGTSRSAVSAPVVSTASGATVTMTVAVLIGVIGILIGAIGGIFVGRSLASTTVTTPSATAPAGTGTGSGTGAAPQLTPEQLQGNLPAGHPSVGSGAATATPGK